MYLIYLFVQISCGMSRCHIDWLNVEWRAIHICTVYNKTKNQFEILNLIEYQMSPFISTR